MMDKEIKIFRFNSIYDEPKFQIKRNKDFIEYGADNNAPAYIASLLEMSGTHAAIVNGIIDYVQGEGLKIPTNAKAKAFYDNGFGGMNLQEIYEKLVVDLVVQGACLINARWEKGKRGVAALHHVDVEKMRYHVDKTNMWICEDWMNWRKNDPELFRPFDLEKGGSQLMYVRVPHARKTIYSLPAYWSIREYIEADQELITFHLNRQRNGFFPSTIMVLEGDPTPEEMDHMYSHLTKFFGGSMNGGRAALIKAQGLRFEKFEASDVPADFELLQRTVDNKIRVGHRISGNGQIFGLGPTEGMHFSSKDDLRTEFDLFVKSTIIPYQRTLLRALNKISAANGISHQWEVEPFRLITEDEKKEGVEKKEKSDKNIPSDEAISNDRND